MPLPLIELTDAGLYCRQGNFHIDPWQGVARAILTHAHSDHARLGSARYLTSSEGVRLAAERLGREAVIDGVAYGEELNLNGVRVSLHPAGHILGSAQVRLEHAGQVYVVSGDYKTQPDRTCAPFEPVRCHTYLTESTFGLPIYRWRDEAHVFDDLHAWWRRNQEQGRTSLLYAYALGKSQRVLAGLDPAIGPILVHGAIDRFLPHYEAAGVRLPPTERATRDNARATRGRALVIAPPSAAGTPWLRKFGPLSAAMASGWMQIRGMRRRRALDAGFPLSDHADWEGLLGAIAASEAQEVYVTHGYIDVLAHWLNERGIRASVMQTAFEGELASETAGPAFESEDLPSSTQHNGQAAPAPFSDPDAPETQGEET
ncbi:MAG TPA: ligase-associated DNA damage response exonuclease [Pirellulales bacterium]|nr:ligase-associated DNA damage response exonuclease [Pirellulales bacterium]